MRVVGERREPKTTYGKMEILVISVTVGSSYFPRSILLTVAAWLYAIMGYHSCQEALLALPTYMSLVLWDVCGNISVKNNYGLKSGGDRKTTHKLSP